MKFVLLFVLAALWAVVLVPPLLRARTGRSSDSIGDFNNHLGVLSRTNGSRRRGPRGARQLPVLSRPATPMGAAYAPRASAGQRAAKRRRDITLGLVVAATLTLAFATMVQSSSVWLLQIVVDLLLVGYIGLLVWARQLQVERAATVRYLPPRRAPELALRPAPVALRRTASS